MQHREGHAGGGYSSGNRGFAELQPQALVDLNQAMQRQTLVVKKIHLELIQWISRTTIFHSKNGFNELKQYKGELNMAQQRRGGFKRRKKVDYIAANKIEYVDYKDTELLSRFVSERGKILPRRVTGTSAKNQRKVTTAIKRARVMALMPFVNED